MADTKIEWAEKSWNPITGCTKISEGCKNCYAEKMAKRLKGRFGYSKDNPFEITFHDNKLIEPYEWEKPKMIFVCSMGDLFHEMIPFDFIYQEIFGVMEDCREHKFLILTKRPKRVIEFIEWVSEDLRKNFELSENVWLGVSVENQKRADERIPILLQIPAKVRFVSIEPMLEPINLIWSLRPQLHPDLSCINWVICGAETGPRTRPCNIDWVRDLRDQCIQADVPFFFKKFANGNRLIDGRLWEQYPKL